MNWRTSSRAIENHPTAMTNDIAHEKLVIYFVCEAIMQSVCTLSAGKRFKTKLRLSRLR